MPIKTTIIVASSVVFGVTLLLFSLVIYDRTRTAEFEKLDARLESQADRISTEVEEEFDQGVFPDTSEFSKLAGQGIPGSLMEVLDSNGNVLLADPRFAPDAAPGSRDTVSAALRPESVDIRGVPMRRLRFPSEPGDRFRYVVVVAAPLAELQASLQTLILFLSIGGALALAASSAATFLITRRAFQPVTGMILTANEIGSGNLHRRLEVPRTADEVRALATTLNTMIDRIDRAFRSQQQFVADASHEIRTPLAVMMNELEFAEQRVTDPAVKESLQTAISETDRLTRLAGGLLLLARSDAMRLPLTLAPVRVDELIVECVQGVRNIAAKKQIEFRIDVEEPVEMPADRDKLKSILLNLIDNAVKYSPERRTVRLTLARGPGKVVIAVEDQGYGIPAESLPHVFDRFYRVDPSRTNRDGTGLGLAITQLLVALHGASIEVSSEPGKGSTFTLVFPDLTSQQTPER